MTNKFIFIHIPKNAGTTLNQILAKNYRNVCRVSWNEEDADHYSKLMTRGERGLFDECDIIRGHFPYGMHQLLSEPSKCQYMTMLRDPVRRTMSTFSYLKHDSTFVNSRDGLKRYIDSLSIRDFVLAFHPAIPNHIYVDNGQVRYLSGIGATRAFGQMEMADLDRAKDNLAKMVFGITEEFKRSMLLFRRALPIDKILYANKKVGSVSASRLSDEDAALVRQRNKLDIELYRFGAELFESRTSFVTQQMLDGYESRLKAYKRLDDLKGILIRMARKLKIRR